MNCSSLLVRTANQALGVLCALTSWLLLASVADGAAAASAPAASPLGCDAAATLWHAAAPRLPVLALSPAEWAGLSDARAVLRRGATEPADQEYALIKDEAPAARIDVDEGLAPPLDPIDTLAGSVNGARSRRPFSRRSPRGPPVFR